MSELKQHWFINKKHIWLDIVENNDADVVEYFGQACAVKQLPVLYKLNANGKSTYWKIFIIEEYIFVRSGQVGGKEKIVKPTQCVAKNVGRSNQTTPKTQAIFEAHSKWEKKQDQGYAIQLSNDNLALLPMLAQSYEKQKAKLGLRFGLSPKLDGIRALTRFQDDRVILTSRKQLEFDHLHTIREQMCPIFEGWPDLIFDGELYSHNIPFNVISGIVRSKNQPHRLDDQLEYWIFDLAITDMGYEERMEQLKEIEQFHHSIYENEAKIKFVFSTIIEATSRDEADQIVNQQHSDYVAQGFEGLIARGLDAPYRFNYRSPYLLKYKHFEDHEFLVIDVEAGAGNEEGAVVFVCQTENGERFTVRPRGSIDKRKWQYENKDLYVGQMLTVRYQPDTFDHSNTVPRFPVGISFPSAVTQAEQEYLSPVAIRNYE